MTIETTTTGQDINYKILYVLFELHVTCHIIILFISRLDFFGIRVLINLKSLQYYIGDFLKNHYVNIMKNTEFLPLTY